MDRGRRGERNVKHAIFAIIALAGCTKPKDPVAELQNPSTCMECHPKHFTQWQGSMHAYASDDPVFNAMHKRGQRETNGQLGTFCVQCHAPMAVALGIVDETNVAQFDTTTLPDTARGVTCYYCHDAVKTTADHNNGVVLALDQTMRGGVTNPPPADTPAHNSQFSDFVAGTLNNDSSMCGSCHDVVTPSPPSPAAVPLERTFKEWQTTFFATDHDPKYYQSCAYCHMVGTKDLIAQGPGLNVVPREGGFHDHFLPATDQALTSWHETDTMVTEVASILDPAVNIIGATPPGGSALDIPGGICVVPINGGELTVRIDAQNLGHLWPSGAGQDRRAWLEVIAYDASNNVVFSSGVVPDGKDPEDINDPNLLGLWDRAFKSDGTPAHFFWEIANEQPVQLKAPLTPGMDHSTTQVFQIGAVSNQIDHITARVVLRPLNYALLHLLEQSNDLDPVVETQMKTLVTGAGGAPFRTWSRANMDPTIGCCRMGMPSC
jgi:hypothetical protein